MMFFILWVVFLLAVILSVPIVSFLEKRKLQPARRPGSDESEHHADAENEAVEEASAEAAFEAIDETPIGGDDFAEFEEVR